MVNSVQDTATDANRRARLLLVEDMAPNQRFIVRLLEKRGYEVTLAANGAQALELYQSNSPSRPFDVIIMDCQMPVMSGYDAAQKIRELERESGRYTPIIALSALATAEQKNKCQAAGMDEYLNKPVVEEELIGVIETLRSKTR
jgi:CheY-like chemotaxis protein